MNEQNEKKQWLATNIVAISDKHELNEFAYEQQEQIDIFTEEFDRFSYNLMSVMKQPNYVISPISLYYALNCLRLGAAGKARSELDSLLLPSAMIEQKYREVLRYFSDCLNQKDRSLSIEMAQLLLAEAGLNWSEAYINQVEKLHTDLGNLDFGKADEAIDYINSWAEQRTHGMIPKIFETADQLSPNVQLMILNALYFKGTFINPFNSANNLRADFYGVKDVKKVDYMTAVGSYVYGENSDVQLLQIPYAGNAYLEIALGAQNQAMDKVLKVLFSQHNHLLNHHQVDLHLPKFKAKNLLDLKTPLNNLGLASVFQNLGKSTYFIADENSYFVSEVKQQVAFDLNEEGTEAAAVTIIQARVTSMMPGIVKPVEFHVNRPFAYRIVKDGITLFSGIINDF